MFTKEEKTKIKEWHGQSLQKEFNLFIKLWITFNGWYKLKYPNKNDKEAINLCKNDSDLFICYQRSFSYKQFYDYLNKFGFELDKNPLENLTRQRDKKLKLNRLEDKNGEVSFLDNGPGAFKKYLDIIYRVRCNLIHCEKLPSNQRDKLLTECSFKTLSVIMKQIINNF